MSNTASKQTPNSAGPRTYTGGCICGAVRYEVDLDLSKGTTRCNCTFCTKAAWWSSIVKPSAFRLLSGAESLSDYPGKEGSPVHHLFCKVCGIRSFGRGNIPEIGGEYCSVSMNCLDGVDLSGVTVRYLDGRHDTWEELAVAPYVDPFVRREGALRA
jgi:hypothetical protein